MKDYFVESHNWETGVLFLSRRWRQTYVTQMKVNLLCTCVLNLYRICLSIFHHASNHLHTREYFVKKASGLRELLLHLPSWTMLCFTESQRLICEITISVVVKKLEHQTLQTFYTNKSISFKLFSLLHLLTLRRLLDSITYFFEII